MSGFARNRFIDLTESQAKHFVCNICHNILNNGIRLDCPEEHTFCKQCLHNWIDNNHKECPDCDHIFTLKRTNQIRVEPNLILISNYLFKINKMANNMINELKIKCDFESNGCKQSVQLSSLSDHLKTCEHRFCLTCGYPFGNIAITKHNCVETLKEVIANYRIGSQSNDNQLLQNYEESKRVIERQKQVIRSQKTELQTCLSELLSMSQRLFACIEYILIGTFKSSVLRLEVNSDHMKLHSIPCNSSVNESTDRVNHKKKYHITLSFIDVKEILFCINDSISALIIGTESAFCGQIQNCFHLGVDSPNQNKFDVNSKDRKHWYMSIVFAKQSEVPNYLVRYLKSVEPKIFLKEINTEKAKQLLQVLDEH